MPKILAIDDSPTLRKFIAKHIGDRFPDYTVLLASNGADGIQTAQREKPDVILLDYLLPDCKGEEVCRRLESEEATASIPVILMSSSTPDITRTEGLFASIKRSMAKPFSPELLCASVNLVLQGDAASSNGEGVAVVEAPAEKPVQAFSPESAPTALVTPKLQRVSLSRNKPATRPLGTPVLAAPSGLGAVRGAGPGDLPEACGPLGVFPFIDVLGLVQREALTGVLKIEAAPIHLDFYFKEGAVVLGTTRDVVLYLKDAPVKVAPEQEAMLAELSKEQQISGEPIFLQMKNRGFLPEENAHSMIRDYSSLLLGHCWFLEKGRFLMYRSELPPFAADLPALAEAVEQFALESLRNVGTESLAYFQNETSPGTPAYTVAGYRRIQLLTLETEEAELARVIATGGKNLEEIAAELGTELPIVRSLLFRFLKLGVFDYWPDFAAEAEG